MIRWYSQSIIDQDIVALGDQMKVIEKYVQSSQTPRRTQSMRMSKRFREKSSGGKTPEHFLKECNSDDAGVERLWSGFARQTSSSLGPFGF